ncbi:hypothetical protein C6P42_000343 [Pichia californica]|nr:hypothetical protein C6P42_000343 [[Candida] californica]
MSTPKIPTIKIVIAGDLGTGKSSLVNVFTRNMFTELDPTIEDTHCKRVIINDIPYNIEILDTVDNEFHNDHERALIYQQCDAIILTYAINDFDSFQNLIMRYSNLPINEEDGSRKLIYVGDRIRCLPPIILVGTKTDLESCRQVAYPQGKKLQSQLKLQDFIECSCLAKSSVEELFNSVIKLGLTYQLSDKDLTHIYADDENSLKKTPSELSVISKQSKITNSKKSINKEKFAPIEEHNFNNTLADKKSAKVQSNSKNNVIPKNNNIASRNSKGVSSVSEHAKANISSKSSDSCCVIM